MRRKIALSIAVLMSSAAALIAAEPARKTPTPDVPAEKFYKNIQVFQGVPSTEIMPAMNFMKASLGVNCSFCHVTNDSGRWPVELDDKPNKNKAREMIRMMREINRANFKDRLEVTCATCHRGSHDPIGLPQIGTESAAAHVSPDTTEPTAAAVLEKYETAIGGAPALERVSNRRLKGTFAAPNGETHPIEIVQTRDGKYRSAVTLEQGSSALLFDGSTGWTIGPAWKNPMQPDERERVQMRSRLFPAEGLKARFAAVTVRGRESVDGRDAWIVAGVNPNGPRESFWFDVENGLLLRSVLRQHTPLGDLPEQADYSDYREIDGVKVPFTIRHSAPGRSDTVTASEVVQNVKLDGSEFQPGS